MYRTLKEETQRKPPALTLRLQQKKFEAFRKMFNHERSHEGLNNKTPGSIYQASFMMRPRALIGYVYPLGFVIRRVNISADIHRHKGRALVAESYAWRISASNVLQKTLQGLLS
jgi:hypothetical protein